MFFLVLICFVLVKCATCIELWSLANIPPQIGSTISAVFYMSFSVIKYYVLLLFYFFIKVHPIFNEVFKYNLRKSTSISFFLREKINNLFTKTIINWSSISEISLTLLSIADSLHEHRLYIFIGNAQGHITRVYNISWILNPRLQ